MDIQILFYYCHNCTCILILSFRSSNITILNDEYSNNVIKAQVKLDPQPFDVQFGHDPFWVKSWAPRTATTPQPGKKNPRPVNQKKSKKTFACLSSKLRLTNLRTNFPSSVVLDTQSSSLLWSSLHLQKFSICSNTTYWSSLIKLPRHHVVL